MPFEIGNPGGPGRPRGSRNRLNQLLDQLGEANAQEILGKVIDAAREGDGKAQALILKRLWSAPKGRPVEIDLPVVNEPADLLQAYAHVVGAVADQEISPAEAQEVSTLLEAHRRAFELVDQGERMEKLEAELAELRKIVK